jgi:hypothetical protein
MQPVKQVHFGNNDTPTVGQLMVAWLKQHKLVDDVAPLQPSGKRSLHVEELPASKAEQLVKHLKKNGIAEEDMPAGLLERASKAEGVDRRAMLKKVAIGTAAVGVGAMAIPQTREPILDAADKAAENVPGYHEMKLSIDAMAKTLDVVHDIVKGTAKVVEDIFKFVKELPKKVGEVVGNMFKGIKGIGDKIDWTPWN